MQYGLIFPKKNKKITIFKKNKKYDSDHFLTQIYKDYSNDDIT